ncbi:DUF6895 family protein [Saccharothrix syringae]|uniref:DUF6895 domain-containing protein n=1 Tax=Saccharothrix syringae TaxID=103733 RepID=A0A5Q0GZ78_SACSY|nr:hypothetical protein [Saccharothrix syringae]QFZ18692.1 hypothetical protein EKG83_15585 [Saccharothrix syringae]
MTAPVAAVAHQVADRALTFLYAHRDLNTFPEDMPVEPDDPDSTYKALAEASLAAALVLREGVAGTEQLHRARELVDFGWRQVREGDLLYDRQVRNWLITDPVECYAHFTCTGYRHVALDELMAHNATVRSMPELLPNRRLGVANAYRVSGTPTDDDWDAMLRATWLGATPPPWSIDWDTAYSMTHTVFHVTDWGAKPHGLPADIADYLRTWLPVWIDVWSEVQEWDLVGELLIVGACLPEPRCDLAEWRRFAAAQHTEGLMPRNGNPVDDDGPRRFLNHQHATVVAAVAGTLTLSRLLNHDG